MLTGGGGAIAPAVEQIASASQVTGICYRSGNLKLGEKYVFCQLLLVNFTEFYRAAIDK